MKLRIVGALLAFFSVSAFANNNVGCGLGTKVFYGKKGLAPQIMAITTNGTSSNQLFGITFGTLGCSKNGVVGQGLRMTMYLNENLERVAGDIAKGDGESLQALADILKIDDDEEKIYFYAFLKENFTRIYPSAQVQSKTVADNILALLSDDARLKAYII